MMLETEGSISEIDSHHILQEASELSDRVIKQGHGKLSSKHADNHMVTVNNCCLQFLNLRVRFCDLSGYFLLNSLR